MLAPSSDQCKDMIASFYQSSAESSVTRKIQKARFNQRSGNDECAAMPYSAGDSRTAEQMFSAMAEMSPV